MENDFDILIKLAEKSTNDIISYSYFVNMSKDFFENKTSSFLSSSLILKLNQLWSEMEIINALALCEWEETGKSKKFNNIWGKKYKNDAKKTIKKFIEFVNFR